MRNLGTSPSTLACGHVAVSPPPLLSPRFEALRSRGPLRLELSSTLGLSGFVGFRLIGKAR